MGSRASVPTVNHTQEDGVKSDQEIHAKLAELESKLKGCEAVHAHNEQLEKRLSKLEREFELLDKNSERSPSPLSCVNSYLSVKKDTESTSSETSLDPKRTVTKSNSNETRRRRITKEYSISPMNDIEAYGQGLNPHELSKGARLHKTRAAKSSELYPDSSLDKRKKAKLAKTRSVDMSATPDADT